MALINCPECDHQISDQALTCPNCGFQQKKVENVAIEPPTQQQKQPIQKQVQKKSNVLRNVIIIGVLFIIFISIITSSTKKSTLVKKENDSTIVKNEIIDPAKADSIAKANEEFLKEKKKRFEVLKKNFNFKEDEFNKIGWYTNKNQTISNSYNRKCIKAHVNSEGFIYIEDQYYAEDWIFHTRIEVKIGEIVYKSADIPTFNENNRTENGSGSIWENIDYLNDTDNGILKAIAESGKTPVKVRFIGKDHYSDFTLSTKDQKAIQDGYELASIIKMIGNQ